MQSPFFICHLLLITFKHEETCSVAQRTAVVIAFFPPFLNLLILWRNLNIHSIKVMNAVMNAYFAVEIVYTVTKVM